MLLYLYSGEQRRPFKFAGEFVLAPSQYRGRRISFPLLGIDRSKVCYFVETKYSDESSLMMESIGQESSNT
jgi:hypothetical protein